ncbi:uncharacterized protein LOC144887164 [Branchiostoma floridae x Branchiostoma japonicum]
MEEKEKELIDAAGRGDEVRVQQLLAEGVNVNAAHGGWTALHNAARNGHTGTVQALLTAGAPVDSRSTAEHTPLHFAAEKGHTGTVTALLTAGADINARDYDSWTPLHKAAENGHPECVRVLLRAGANTVIKGNIDGNKKTAEELAEQEDVLKVFQFFKDLKPKVVDDLLTIELSGKGLTSVPAEVFDATDIERLVLSENRLTSIPEEIGQLQKLRELELANNLLTQLPQAITTLPNLQHINVSGNKLETLPDGISRLQLHELLIRNNRFKEIPDEVCSLLQLETFSVGDNPLKCLPDKISQLTGLRSMYMDRCQFDEFPRQVLQLEGLETLFMGSWARKGKPSPVPEDIGRLKNLQVLDIQQSGFKSLPDSVGELEQLTYLNITGNRFTSVPEQIMNLPNIEKLDMSDNNISSLPLTLSRLAKLGDMNISGNPLTCPPPDVCEKGTAAMMDFLRRKLKEKEDSIAEKELRKRFHRFSQIVTETREVENLGVPLQLTADEMTSIMQGSKNLNPSYQAYSVLLKWREKDQEASIDKLQQELSDFGMDKLSEEVGRIKTRSGNKRQAGTSAGPPAKRSAAGQSSLDGHQEEQLNQLLEENHTLRALVEELQGKTPRSRGPGAKPVVLLLNDEYGTAKGGVSTIHGQMSSLLASKGAEVYSTVLRATEDDKQDAAADRVQLIFPTTSKRDNREPCLDWLTFDHKARYPDLPPVDFIVGHVPITSHAAKQIKDQRFPDAKLVQITHVMPEDTNPYKSDERILSIGDEQRNILEDLEHADVIVSVGPYLHDYYTLETRGFEPHHEFLPKPSDIFSKARVKYVDAGVKVVLSIGRVKGVERLKGFDLAGKSVGKVMVALPNTKWRTRGITKEDFQDSRNIIQSNAGKIHFTPLEYGTQKELLKDMEKASVVLMPSRAEPFGLVGLEAIAAGVPVLVSHKSGLAMFLKTQHYEFDRTIVEIEDDDEEATQTLSKRIIKILKDGSKEFEAAQSLKEKLLNSEYWAASHTKFLESFGLEG